MMFIEKQDAPIWYLSYIENNSSIKEYKDLDGDIRQRLRKGLVDEQFHICGYCCGKIDDISAHNEHIKPQEQCKGRESLDYNNIIASCSGYRISSDTCGHRKDNEYNESQFVSPLSPECEGHFKYFMNGEIIGDDNYAEYTIDLLNLNSGPLKNARKGVLKASMALSCSTASEIYLHPYDGEIQPFCNIVKYFLDNRADLFAEP